MHWKVLGVINNLREADETPREATDAESVTPAWPYRGLTLSSLSFWVSGLELKGGIRGTPGNIRQTKM